MKNRIESIKAKLRNISKEGNRSHQLTLTRYFQERLLFRLSKSAFKDRFFLKGGVLIYAWKGSPADLLTNVMELIKERLESIYEQLL